ncbi:Ig-like domain repeat protein [Streptomyces sioyaensis]|nr:Ig-like domain repeat protein [Streptomyces sioyaensis]
MAGLATVTHAYTTTANSPYTIAATYGGDPDFSPSAGTASQAVLPSAVTLAVTTGPDPSVAGEPVTVTATATPVPPGAGVPSGTVTVDFGDGTAPSTAPLAGGAVHLTHTYASVLGSPYTVTATYSGSGDFSSAVATATQAVLQDATTTTVTAAPDPSVASQPVTFTAAVKPVAGGGSPTGTVTFGFGDGTPPVAMPVVGGVATVQHAFSGTSGSPYTVTADYGGDTDFTASGGTATQTVDQAQSGTVVASSPDPSVTGQPVTVTATVSAAPPGDGTPTGTVTFDFGDGTPTVTTPVVAGLATATHVWTGTSGSPYVLTADYSGDADFGPRRAPAPSSSPRPRPPPPSSPPRPVGGGPAGDRHGHRLDDRARRRPPHRDRHLRLRRRHPRGHRTRDGRHGEHHPRLGEHIRQPIHDHRRLQRRPRLQPLHRQRRPARRPGHDHHHRQRTSGAVGDRAAGDVRREGDTGRPGGRYADWDGDVPLRRRQHAGRRSRGGRCGNDRARLPAYDGQPLHRHRHLQRRRRVHRLGGNRSAPRAAGVVDDRGQLGAGHLRARPAGDRHRDGLGDSAGRRHPDRHGHLRLRRRLPAVTAPVTDGTASITHVWPSTSGSPYTITADYSGDAGFTPCSATGTQTVAPAATTTAVVSSPDLSVAGQSVTLTATVAPVAPGDGTPTGTVTFDLGDGTPAVTVAVAAGTATVTHTWGETSGSPYPITADYSGDSDFSPSTGADAQTVGQASSGVTLVSSPDPSVAGQAVTFTARVTAVPPGAGTPTGTVTFDFGDGTAPVTAPVSGGVATFTHAYAAASDTPYTVTAQYSGDADFAPGTGTDLHTVSAGAATTSTTVSSSPDPTVTGQPVTFTATVAPTPPGAGVPTGTVTFDFGDGTAAITAPVSGGVATVAHTYRTATGSPYTVTAHYSGDANFSSSSGADLHTVAPASTRTTVTTAPDPSVAGQPVTLTATVAPLGPGAGVPTGLVTFDFGDGAPATSAPVSGGVARATHTYTSAGGPFTVTAHYEGDTSFLPSDGTDTQTVNKAATTTAVVSSPDPTVVGQPTTITATVASAAPGAGTPTGTVTFDFGDGTAPVTAPTSSGLASVAHTYTGTSGSPYTLTATYNGDPNYTSSSGTDPQTVNKAATTTALTSSPDPSVVGQLMTVTATVASIAPGAGTPTGTVTFDFGDGTPTATAPLSGGVATVTHTSASSSPYTLTATYSGDANYTASSGTDTQTVNKAATTTAVVSSPDPTVVGQPTTITATVASVAPGAGTPTGTVTFSFGDGTPTTTATLSGGTATTTHTYTGTSGSPYTLTATYNGDPNYTSSSGTDPQTVNKAATTTALASSPDPTVVGQTVTLTAAVSALAPGAGTPTGTVTFSFGDGTPTTTATLSGGTATTTHTYTGTSGSPYTLTATYNGSTNFTASSGSDTQTVSKAATTTTVTSAPDPSAAGQTVTLTAAVSALAPGAGTPTGTVTFSFGTVRAPPPQRWPAVSRPSPTPTPPRRAARSPSRPPTTGTPTSPRPAAPTPRRSARTRRPRR